MSDLVKRVASWMAKYNLERVKATLDDLKPEMARRYQAAVADLYAMEIKTKETLNAQGVQTILYVSYLNYSRQLFKLSRKQKISGESMQLAAQVLLDKWKARGCDPKVLAEIRSQVYDIAAP
jgi:hypothetical protein